MRCRLPLFFLELAGAVALPYALRERTLIVEAPAAAPAAEVLQCSQLTHGLIDYCHWIESWSYVAIPCAVAWVLVLLWLLNDTAEVYFVPPLQYWSARLRLSPCVAGATLVAVGNGAPDLVMASLAPTMLESLHIVICDTICILCVAGGAVLLLRARMAGELDRPAKEDANAACDGLGSFENKSYDASLAFSDLQPLNGKSHVGSAAWLCVALAYLLYLLSSSRVGFAASAVMPMLYLGFLVTLWLLDDGKPYELPPHAGPAPSLPGLAAPKDAGGLQLALYSLQLPSYLLRWILIPPSDNYWDRSRRIFTSLSPVALWLFSCWSLGLTFHSLVMSGWAVATLFTALALSIVLFLSSDQEGELPKLYPLTTLLAKVSSVLLLLAIARELTACVKTMAFYLGVSRYVLETTVMPWGNSLGDLVTAVAMVRQGQSTAAATALFAGPLFNVLLSAGVTLMLATGHGHTLTFGYSKMDQVKATGAAILACLLLLVGLLFEKQVGQMGGYGLLSLYLLFVVGVVVAELGV